MNFKNIKGIQKYLIIANIIMFGTSLIFMRFSDRFRIDQYLHWIYTLGHCWYLMAALSCFFWGSLISGAYTIWKIKTNKILYLVLSLFPLILFLTIIFFII